MRLVIYRTWFKPPVVTCFATDRLKVVTHSFSFALFVVFLLIYFHIVYSLPFTFLSLEWVCVFWIWLLQIHVSIFHIFVNRSSCSSTSWLSCTCFSGGTCKMNTKQMYDLRARVFTEYVQLSIHAFFQILRSTFGNECIWACMWACVNINLLADFVLQGFNVVIIGSRKVKPEHWLFDSIWLKVVI